MILIGDKKVPFEVWTEDDLRRMGFQYVVESNGDEGYLITDSVVLPRRLYWQNHPSDYWVKAARIFTSGELHMDGSESTTTKTQEFKFGDLRLFSSDTDNKVLALVMRMIHQHASTSEILEALYGKVLPDNAEIPGWGIRGYVFSRTYTLGVTGEGGGWAKAYKTGKIRSVRVDAPFLAETLDREEPLFYESGSFLIEGVDAQGQSFTAPGQKRDFYANPASKIVRYSEWANG